jgi:hypothetical protein
MASTGARMTESKESSTTMVSRRHSRKSVIPEAAHDLEQRRAQEIKCADR